MESTSLSPFLFDPTYWKERLARLSEVPQRLVVQRRAECCTSESSVEELRLRAYDGTCLRALLVKPQNRASADGSLTVVVDAARVASEREASEPNAPLTWPHLGALTRRAAAGRTLVLVPQEGTRRLEDRVLDLLRTVDGVQNWSKVRHRAVEFESSEARDEVEIVRALIEMRWA